MKSDGFKDRGKTTSGIVLKLKREGMIGK